MGKKHKVSPDKSNNKAKATVDIEKDIANNNKQYDGKGITTADLNDTSVLSDMFHEYDKIRDSLDKYPTLEDEERAKRMSKKKLSPIDGAIFDLDETEPAMGEVILGAVILGVVVVGFVTIGRLGFKSYKAIRSII